MAIAFGAAVLDGAYTKIFTFTALDTDVGVGNQVAIDFTTEGMTDLPSAPTEVIIETTGSAADVPLIWGAPVAGVLATGVTICLHAATGGGGGAVTGICICRVIHSKDR